MIEYFGPILIHSLFYFLPNVFYPNYTATPKHLVQTVAFYCVIFHFVKRELETLFVHHFSNATMPLFNLFKNCTHYWLLSGLSIAYFLYHPLYTPPAWLTQEMLFGATALFLIAELMNLHCHLILMWLRPKGTRVRGIPKGNLFTFVSCANYTWELTAWLIFSVFTQTLTAYFFLVVSFGQIYLWSVKKHKQYRAEFTGENGTEKYPRRKVLIPFLL
eukprot:TRINITY_DN1480_c0_g1_i6.p2 TRINITY_DN1480_c0_g1~~TRINITY_DN1480_c0_g1_i6.p2  ORF type:complete len:217 (+),score=58.78 TRINITY_DN1480_c0_g1_i6:199-849(+)